MSWKNHETLDFIPINRDSKSESKEHFLLKQIGRSYMYINFRCIGAATEVVIPYINSVKHPLNTKRVIDVCGIAKKRRQKDKKYYYEKITYGMEAKVSVQDFKSGFCMATDYLHIITTPSLISKDMLPEGVGLIEVDLDEFMMTDRGEFWGVNLVKKAKRLNLPESSNIKFLEEHIMSRMTSELVYKNQFLNIRKQVLKIDCT